MMLLFSWEDSKFLKDDIWRTNSNSTDPITILCSSHMMEKMVLWLRKGKGSMEAVTLPCLSNVSGISMEKLVTEENRLVLSIQMELPRYLAVSNPVSILNDPKQINRLRDMNDCKRLLTIQGIPTRIGNHYLREYVLFIFQTDVLAIYRSKTQKVWLADNQKKQKRTFQIVPVTSREREVRKVLTFAIRSLYALGLDYGAVKCGIAPGNQVVVLHINPQPQVNAEMRRRFSQAIKEYMQGLSKGKMPLEHISLGADPEFVVQSPKGNLVIASRYLPIQGKIGCDAIWIGQNRSNKPVVEVRPDPTSNPRKLVIRIYEQLLSVAKRMNAVSGKWLAGALPYQGFPLGGHIHFGGLKPNFKMLRALDNYLSFPLIVVEDEKGIKRRPKYGFLGDYRLKDHGGFEYRTPPSWLISPTLTKGVLALAQFIVANYQFLPHDPLSDPELKKAYYHGDKRKIRDWITHLWSDVQKLKDYRKYESFLDPFYRYLLSGRTWNESQDFRRLWRLPPYHKRK